MAEDLTGRAPLQGRPPLRAIRVRGSAGVSLMAVVVAMLLLSALAAALAVFMAEAHRSSTGLAESNRALAIAESGIEWSIKNVRERTGTFAFAGGGFTVARSGQPGDFAFGQTSGAERVKIYCASAQWTSTGRYGAAMRRIREGTAASFSNIDNIAIGDDVPDIEPGDLDADGDNDLVLVTAAAQIRVYLNDGAGDFTEQGSSPYAANSAVKALALGDMDGDGDLDVVVADNGASPYKLEVWKNDGSAVFTLDAVYTIGGKALGLDVRDVKEDADGDVDVVVSTDANQFEVWTNGGTGALTRSSTLGVNDATAPNALVLSDVDQDADNDVMLVTAGSNMEKWLNNGSGAFTYSSSNALGFAGLSIAAGEFDGVAGEDMLVGEQSDDFQTFFNDGAGTFTPNATTDVLGDVYACDLFDMDGDGDLDAVLAEMNADRVQVFLNNGSGAFTLDSTTSAGGDAKSLAVGEFNYGA